MARPREFDEAEALERAMGVFWTQGYEATSVEDLVGGTGLNRGSLYAAFGDKNALFLRALEHYRCQRMEELTACLEGTPDPRQAFRRLFLSFVERPDAERARGCLLVNSAMERAPHEPQTGRAIAQHLKTLEGTFLRALERAREAGQLEATRELRPLARYLVGALQGLIVMAKGQPDRRVLRDIVDVSLSVLDARG